MQLQTIAFRYRKLTSHLEDDDNGDLDRQERRVRARLHPVPAQPDDESASG